MQDPLERLLLDFSTGAFLPEYWDIIPHMNIRELDLKIPESALANQFNRIFQNTKIIGIDFPESDMSNVTIPNHLTRLFIKPNNSSFPEIGKDSKLLSVI